MPVFETELYLAGSLAIDWAHFFILIKTNHVKID